MDERMTVAELIEKLRGFDPETKVVFPGDEPDKLESVKGVELTHVGKPYRESFFNCMSPKGVVLITVEE
jgi:hypothetical protein